METYWDAFNRKYGKACLNKSLTLILQAFWHYCNHQESMTKQLLRPTKVNRKCQNTE